MDRHFFAFGSGPPFTDNLAEKYIKLTKNGPVSIILAEREGWQAYMPNYTSKLKTYHTGGFSYIPLPTIQEKQAVKELAAKHPACVHYGIDEDTGLYFHNGRLETMEGEGVYQMEEGKCRKIHGG